MAHVLIVDDDQEIRATLRMALEDDGHAVAEAANGKIAIDILRASADPFVVLLDSFMPEMDGERMLHVVAGDPVLASRHRYVFMTARATRLAPESEEIVGAIDVPIVAKPFDITTLLEQVAASARQLP